MRLLAATVKPFAVRAARMCVPNRNGISFGRRIGHARVRARKAAEDQDRGPQPDPVRGTRVRYKASTALAGWRSDGTPLTSRFQVG